MEPLLLRLRLRQEDFFNARSQSLRDGVKLGQGNGLLQIFETVECRSAEAKLWRKVTVSHISSSLPQECGNPLVEGRQAHVPKSGIYLSHFPG